MSKLSVIIPSREEVFLTHTVNDLIAKAHGDIEVIAVLDGYWPQPPLAPLPEHKNFIVLHRGQVMGMRAAINAAAAVAKGEWLMKCDAHCLFAEGYDEALKADCDDNWVVIPRRHSLDAENWAVENNPKGPRDYHYLCFPQIGKEHDNGMHGVEWPARRRERSSPEYDIDDTMSFQGSCWFMKKAWFDNFLEGMNEEGYGTFSQEPQEIGNKTWLGGGELKVNKKTYYAHLHKGTRYGRMYHMDRAERDAIVYSHNWSADYWMNNRWDRRIHDIDWLVEKFWPVPTWPDNWKEIANESRWI